jgi:hypothetical protein
MEHIKDILAKRQASLSVSRAERGSGEWSAFNAVRDDRVSMYRVLTPKTKKAAPVLRGKITVTKHPSLFPRPAHS